MVELIVNNSYSQIKGLDEKHFTALRKLLSYNPNPNSHFYSGRGLPQIRYLLDKQGFFPTGLLSRVRAYLKETKVQHNRQDAYMIRHRRYPHKLKASAPTPYPEQTEACHKALLSNRGGLILPTGAGKSYVIAMLINELRVKTLIVVPTTELKRQLTESLKALFTNTEHITVENIDSTSLKKVKDYDCLVLDEAHHSASATYHKLNKTAWTGIYYRFFLSATYYRNQPEETLPFEAIAGPPVYELTAKQAIARGLIVPVEAYYHSLPKQPTDASTYAQVYSELVVNNEYRNLVIAHQLLNLNAAGIATLCLIREVKHGKILSDLTGLPFMSGQDEDSRHYLSMFNEGKITALIGTEGVLGEGCDTKPAEFILIAGLGKAKSAFLQKCGRGVRRYKDKESCKVILFRDAAHKYLLNHFNVQVKILKEVYGIDVLKLD